MKRAAGSSHYDLDVGGRIVDKRMYRGGSDGWVERRSDDDREGEIKGEENRSEGRV